MDDENGASAVAGKTDDGIVVKQQKSPRRKKAAEAGSAASEPASVEKPGPKRKTYSESEKAEKLKLIGKKVAEGMSTLQEVVKSAGISVQTYYQWKRNEKQKPAAKKNEVPAARKVERTASGGSDLAELVQLEAENNRLRGLLAEKLRAENLELRKRLGLN
ncbi:transposase [Aminobacter anthyllidis]|uniref:Transposase n=1 Tax=Aminobacter anthyllidis TaxID=1035067 RepID=A0A9X1AHX2_9HYPH|nr:transposase [Aminobacter anthyllidis]MBT1160152.1 transposase [Aminobacter anthyllidis]